MSEKKQLYRSRNALLGGVCEGMATYYNVDSLLVRILTVALTLLTVGLSSIVYLIFWIIVPKEPEDKIEPVEVKPEEVLSERYSRVDFIVLYPYQDDDDEDEDYVQGNFPQGLAKAGLIFGLVLLFFMVVTLADYRFWGAEEWQLWPFALIILGLVFMIVPAGPDKGTVRFVEGLLIFTSGCFLLPFCVEVATWESIVSISYHLWPFLVVMIILFIVAGVTKRRAFWLFGGLAFVAFCLLGLLFFSSPGPSEATVAEIYREFFFWN